MQHKIISETNIIDHGFIKLVKADIEVDSFHQGKEVITRYGLIRPEVVAAILYRQDIDALILIEQFRFSAIRTGNGWVEEIIAGVVEEGEDFKKAAQRECLEEAGYQVGDDFRQVLEFYPSVGLSNQIIHLYYGEVNSSHKVNTGGGLKEEQEDIRVIEEKTETVFRKLMSNQYLDAKAIIGLMWFFHNIKKNIHQ